MKQTAVEWLCEKYHLKKDIEIVKQAIEMEKEQMRSASCPYIGGWEDEEFEYWYNEKYKK
jgi:hypothetical protein